MKNRTTAGVLALLLGGLGVHRFYLKQIGLGILYLVFFWTFIPAIVALVDGIIILLQSDESFNAKYNEGISIPVNITNVADELLKLSSLKDQGVITELEFQNRKGTLLRS